MNQQVPIISLDHLSTGRWYWKDESQSLEFLSSNPAAEKEKLRRERRQKVAIAAQEKNASKRNDRATPNKYFGMQRSSSPGKKQKSKQETHTHVTLGDVKSVALDKMFETETVSSSFVDIISTDQFDEFLMYLLNYFCRFYEKRTHDEKPNPMNIEPSVADLQYYANLCAQLQAAQKRLGHYYCMLVLGIGMEHNHHMACGKSRVSSGASDKRMYENIYSFCTFAVWLTFKRKDYESVRKEIGRMLRSDTFNPAIRIKNAPDTDNGEDESKEATDDSVKSAERQQKEKPKELTPAEYRRLQGKRPAIKSIINQRSPALVAILPSPKEEAHWLFKKSSMPQSTIEDGELDTLQLSVKNLKIGIIGEPLSQYNPQTLTPIGAENEEEEDGEREKMRRESTMTSNSNAKTPQSQDLAISRQPTALSTATTEALSDEED